MSHTTATTTIRNYCVLAATVALMTIGLTDIFSNPYRVIQQEKFDRYGQYIKIVLVILSEKYLN